MALDATSREVCTIRRIATNTPVAAFALLNDPVYIEAAQALARQIVEQDAEEPADRVKFAFRQVLARQPTADELQKLTALFESERKHYEADEAAANEMAASESTDRAKSDNIADLAAWTVVSNVLLNLDETLNK
jgi:hypothetical protein